MAQQRQQKTGRQQQVTTPTEAERGVEEQATKLQPRAMKIQL